MINTSILGRRLLLSIISFSFFITLIASAAIIYSDYRAGIKQINSSIESIEAVYLPSVAFSLWNYDHDQLLLQLKGINSFPGVVTCQVIDEKGNLILAFGETKNHEVVEQFIFPLSTEDQGDKSLGKLIISITKEGVYSSLINKVMVIVGSQFFKTLTISFFILFLVYKMITRHLRQMANWAQHLDIENFDDILLLDRSPLTYDELSVVTNALNQLRNKVSKYHSEINESKVELKRFNLELETRVNLRTKDLNNMITRLNDTIEELQSTQNKLMEAEKHASLSQLVAGVAHEINTPLGLCVTTQSYIEDNIASLQKKIAAGDLSKEELIDYYHSLPEGMELLRNNLNKASLLINSFKQVAADTSTEQLEIVNICSQIDVAKARLTTEFSSGQYRLHTSCPAELEITSYPYAICNVFHTLMQNSFRHAFDTQGDMYIDVKCDGNNLIIDYKDNGLGISQAVAEKIFDPFFTTCRNQGDAGLGMHTLHNIVTQVLAGKIVCTPAKTGALFHIIIKDFKVDTI